MQHLDRSFEHFDKFHQAAIGPAQCTGEAVGVRVVLGEMFQLADVHLADQRGNILIVLIARFGLGDGDLMQHRGPQLDHLEFGDVAVIFLQALGGPRRHDITQVAARDAVIFFQDRAIFVGIEQP